MSTAEELEQSLQGYEQLKEKMQMLKTRLSEYLESVQADLLAKKRNYETSMIHLQEKERDLNTKLRTYESLHNELLEELNRLISDRDASMSRVQQLKIEEEKLLREKKEHENKIQVINDELEESMKAISERETFITKQSDLIEDKAFQLEQLLGLRMENAGVDNHILFVFRNVDSRDYSREVSFVFDPENYSIVETDPVLDPDTVKNVMDNFLRHQEIGYLWRDMRREFKRKVRS
ncbi:hypothetical protein KL905_003634 [Ogataea polymorpha]|uniref:Kinetochore protein SPC25 n=1 Tax=Ogataea polymorpha TaxID=460523 RepID=A0A1B7SAP0_9ASCO|nr:uncharacterized protein OGAPODRAFT_77987 [Ogataea polymorpha]KAG7878971.1 hypothetical protein KL937_003384 [Ogataea polymorpha]KAG7887836.1 hypothetical protein KL936_003854 [Ogataea polymorpha]KAG7892033.1 hypothetical protein KL908_003638 [Ogataea polymorpha]KAG7899290.1 hypothetical protein KL935_003600 [Ogataea polymorpha]KAG7904506.1 hypothetical protein KL907_003382 [Ogataea polymorpha]